MKKTRLTLLSVLFCAITFAQSVPQGINYQAVSRDASGAVLMNQALTIQFSVISDLATSAVSWQETHQDTTNAYGLFTAIIGQGISTSVGSSATFDVIDWGASNHLLKVEVDYGGGFVEMGTTAFMSVPYALHSQNLLGCTDSTALNYSVLANTDDGSCIILGCMDSSGSNYNPLANLPSFCIYLGCTDPLYTEYNPLANTNDGSCTTVIVNGCTDSTAINYNPSANTDDGSCITVIVNGCTDSTAINYNPSANTDDGSCVVLNPLTLVVDDNFENYLENNGMGDGIMMNNYVYTSNIQNVTNLDISGLAIMDFSGIENFISLQELRCQDNGVMFGGGGPTSLSLPHASNLTYLDCSNNWLSYLLITNCSDLQFLNCSYNNLTSIDVSTNTLLTDLNLISNNLTSIDVSTNTLLTDLNLISNDLTSIYISTNTLLTGLNVGYNDLTSIDISTNTLLTDLNVGGNDLTSIDISTNTLLTNLNVRSNFLTSIDLSQNTALLSLNINYNELITLDLSHNTSLSSFQSAYAPYLTQIDIRNGNNVTMNSYQAFYTSNSPNLACVSVDDPIWSNNNTNWRNSNSYYGADPWTLFSADCNAIYGCTDSTATNYNAAANTDDGSCISVVNGCTNPIAFNYDSLANQDDSSCVAVVNGCTDSLYTEYDPLANTYDGTCATLIVNGCTDSTATNYDASATQDDGTCTYCVGTYANITLNGGLYPNEVSWTLTNSMNTVVATGGAPFLLDICLADDCYTVDMFDSYGDGWNGSTFNLDGVVLGTILNGSTGSFTFSTGSAFCAITGCTDSTASNYDATATVDDGSCVAVANPFSGVIGDTLMGGIVFYIFQAGDIGYVSGQVHGLIAAPSDHSTSVSWGCHTFLIWGTSTAIGTGQSNTSIIQSQCSYSTAGQICGNLTFAGSSDWFLPSQDELNKMYVNLHQQNLGGFTNDTYWSSSEYSGMTALYQSFTSGFQGNDYKQMNHKVRAVRAF